jgi:hypothetical protein
VRTNRVRDFNLELWERFIDVPPPGHERAVMALECASKRNPSCLSSKSHSGWSNGAATRSSGIGRYIHSASHVSNLLASSAELTRSRLALGTAWGTGVLIARGAIRIGGPVRRRSFSCFRTRRELMKTVDRQRSLAPIFRRLCGSVFALAVLASTAFADPIVYTGEPQGRGWVLSSRQWLAGEFTVTQPYTLTSVEGWMYATSGGELTVSLYAGFPGDPPVFSQTLLVQAPMTPDWTGATNVQWPIVPGSYWAAFEVVGASTFAGAMQAPSPHPVVREAYRPVNRSGPDYFPSNDLDLGLRVLGDPVAPTPEPATLALFLSGLLGIGARAWGRRRQTIGATFSCVGAV